LVSTRVQKVNNYLEYEIRRLIREEEDDHEIRRLMREEEEKDVSIGYLG